MAVQASSHVLDLPTWLRRSCQLSRRGLKHCIPFHGSWLLILLSLAGKKTFNADCDIVISSASHHVRSSPQGLGPRLLEPLLSELRFSNTTGASLNCAVAGQPPPRVTWLREGVEVEPLQGLLFLLPNGTLRFPPFTASQFRQEVHGSAYRCRAENMFGAILSTEVRVRAVVEQYYEVQVYDEFTIAGNTAVLRCHVPSFVRDDVIVVSWEQKIDNKVDVVVNDLKVNVPPRITNVRSSIVASEGDSVQLPCAAQGYPPPKYIWERLTMADNGSPRNPVIVGSSRHEPTEGSLLIRKVEPQDAGKYLCLVTNVVGEERATITLDVQSPVEARIVPEVLTTHVGQPASLRCVSTGRPPPQIRWFKDAQELLHDDVHIRLLDDRHLMQLATVATQDDGIYQCLAYNALTQAQASAQLILGDEAGVWRCVAINSAGVAEATARVALRGPPTVRPFVSNRTAVATETLEMHCALLTYPIKSVHWEKDGRKLPFHHRQKVFANGTLLLLATTVHDAGKYTCVASNEEGQKDSASLHVTVKVPPLIERFAFDENLHEGMRTRVYCNIARGDPPVRITWLRDGQPVKSSPDIEVRVLDPFSVALAIDSLSPSHDGSYTCVASNTAATVNYTAPLRVHVPPHWINEPADTSAVEGHSASMDCAADGHPTPRVTWHRGVVPARFNESYRNQTAKRGHGVDLECRASGDAPVNISWSHNGRRLDTHKLQGSRVNAKSLPDGLVSTLSLSGAQREHSGMYACEVANNYGQDEKHIRLIVQEPPEAPVEFNVTSVNSRSASLAWRQPYNGNSPILSFLIQYKNATVHWSTDAGRWVRNPPVPELRHGSIRGYYVGYKLHNSSDLHLYKTVESGGEGDEAPGECVLNNLRKFTKYNVLVQAYNAVGAGPRSDEVVVYTAEHVPQVAPSGVHCSASSATSLRVSWAVLHEKSLDGFHKGYRVLYKMIDHNFYGPEEVETASSRTGSAWTEHDVSSDVTSVMLDSVEPFHNYSVRIAARTGAGPGAFSEPVHCTTPEDVPEAPADIKALVLAPDAILISWLPPPRANGILQRYTVYNRVHSQASNQQVSGALPARPVSVPASHFWHETRGLRTGQRYEFWATASTGAGEGPATRIITQSPEVRAPARIASFSREVSVALKQDLELPCRTAGQPTPVKGVEDKEYEVHYKREHGSWGLVHVDPPQPKASGGAGARETPSPPRLASATRVNGTWLAHELTGLSCGTQYHIYVVTVADRGHSEPSDTVFARTKGGVPSSPKQKAFVSANANSLTLRPSSWASGSSGCPVSHLSVQYRPRDSSGPWTVASRSLQPREGPMTLHHLRPDTWYNLRVTAHTEAGTTSAEYAIRTLPASATLTGTVHPEFMVGNGGGGADGDLTLLVPIATSLSLALTAAALVLGYLCCRRRADPTFDKGRVVAGDRSASNDTLAESVLMKRSSIDNVLSTLTSVSGRQGVVLPGLTGTPLGSSAHSHAHARYANNANARAVWHFVVRV
ncbi:hypothetical protein MRX96_054575 [Rhipicephalus microplus]